MIITDEDFDRHMSWVKDREMVRDRVNYMQMGGYHFPTENPMREVVWVAIHMQDHVWDWERNVWVKEKQNEMV